jgi:hypothetical protein
LPADQLEPEITESVVMTNGSWTRPVLGEERAWEMLILLREA